MVPQTSIALAAGAEYVYCPTASASLIAAAKARGLDVIAAGMTPSEVGLLSTTRLAARWW